MESENSDHQQDQLQEQKRARELHLLEMANGIRGIEHNRHHEVRHSKGLEATFHLRQPNALRVSRAGPPTFARGADAQAGRLDAVVGPSFACYTQVAYGLPCSSSRLPPSPASSQVISQTTSIGGCRRHCLPIPRRVRSWRRLAVSEKCAGRGSAARQGNTRWAADHLLPLHRGRTNLVDDALREGRTRRPDVRSETYPQDCYRR